MVSQGSGRNKLISFVLPVYNNAGSINPLYEEVCSNMHKVVKKYDFEMVFVNDGSNDSSIDVLKVLSGKDKRILVVNLSRNFGHQAAVTAGLDKVNGDAVIIMDADLQDPPAVCLELISKWEEGYEVVYAQRRTRKDTFFKRISADFFYRILTIFSSVDIPRNTGDFRLIDRKVLMVVRGMKEHDRFLRGMFSYVGFKHVAVPFDRHARYDGKSEYTIKKLMKLGKDGIFGFSEAPLKLATSLGFFVSLLSIVGILYALAIKIFWSHIAVPGWTMIVVSIFFMAGVQLTILGIIGEYIGRIYTEVRNRPNYIISEEIKQGIRHE